MILREKLFLDKEKREIFYDKMFYVLCNIIIRNFLKLKELLIRIDYFLI